MSTDDRMDTTLKNTLCNITVTVGEELKTWLPSVLLYHFDCISYCVNHFIHMLWKVSGSCALLTSLGKLLHIRQHVILCLWHSFLGWWAGGEERGGGGGGWGRGQNILMQLILREQMYSLHFLILSFHRCMVVFIMIYLKHEQLLKGRRSQNDKFSKTSLLHGNLQHYNQEWFYVSVANFF